MKYQTVSLHQMFWQSAVNVFAGLMPSALSKKEYEFAVLSFLHGMFLSGGTEIKRSPL